MRNRLRNSSLHAGRPYVSPLPDSGTSVASYGMVNSPYTEAISTEAEETSSFYGRVSLYTFSLDGRRRVYRRRGECFADACDDEGIGLGWLPHDPGRNCARGKITVDCCRGQFNSSKIQG